MASLVLGAAFAAYFGGTYGAVVGAVAGAVGGAVGGYVDSTFVYPAIFGGPTAPKLGGVTIQSVSEGGAKNFFTGYEYRVSGQVIWRTPLRKLKGGGGGGKGGGSAPTSDKYYMSVAIDWGEGPCDSVRKVWADSKLIYDADTGALNHDIASMVHYLGTYTQMPDPTIEAWEGAGNVPAYRGDIYTLIKNIYIANWGNRMPQFSALIRKHDGSCSVTQAIQDVMDFALIDPAFYDLSGIATNETWVEPAVGGASWAGPTIPASMLEPICSTFSVIARDSNGVLVFLPRDATDPVATVPEVDLSAHELGNDADSRGMRSASTAAWSLPTDVTLTYIDSTNDYQDGAQGARRQFLFAPVNSDVSVPIAMTPDQGASLALKALWSGWSERYQATAQAVPKWTFLEAGDKINLFSAGKGYTVRLSECNEGANFIAELKGTTESALVLDASTPGEPTPPPVDGGGNPIPIPATLLTAVMDIAPLRDSEIQSPGFYVAAALTSSTDVWSGASVYYSLDNVNYTLAASLLPNQGTFGTVATAVPNTGPGFDAGTTITVEVVAGTVLESADASQVINSQVNWCKIGNEILAFETATVVDATHYVLTNLWRQLRDTSGGHSDGEQLVLLDFGSMQFFPVPASLIGRTIWVKVVPAFGLVDSYTFTVVPFTGGTCRPFHPFNFAQATTGGDDITLTWDRNSRYPRPADAEATGPVGPLDESVEKYQVYIYDGSLLRRTVTVTDTSYVWQYADQVTDGRMIGGVVPGTPVTARVRQVGRIVTAGNMSTISP